MTSGLVLNDRYRLLELLATGGMGEVWRAVDDALAREVAVKLLREELVTDEAARRRFASEARYAAALRHGGIAALFDAREHDGRAYLVMELVEGEPLSRRLARTGGLPVDQVLDLVEQTAAALACAHGAGIVHRDVKPPNLMITGDGTVKITDFGIARGLKAASQTQTGMVMGSAHYISPEQASGRPISPAADLYSLGVVAYECLTGVPPFDGRTPVEIALQHVRDVPPPLPRRVPAGTRDLVAEMLAKDPADRPADAAGVAARARVLAGRPPPPRSPGPAAGFDGGDAPDTLTSGEVTGRRRPVLVYCSVAAGLLLVVAVAVGSVWSGGGSAGLVGDRRTAPPSTGPATDPAPGSARPSPTWYQSPRIIPNRSAGPGRASTPGRSGASPEHRPNRKPKRAGPGVRRPAPGRTGATTTPSTPSPARQSVQGGRLGSEDKV
ncbi:serine/threonine-protein kinase [Actinomadura parmotrematis]|uniref:non-specific serine/threonine protein kinase n=1 Tax=Actinomadura parmotrematis TaxID=2864039 RepID=A0ABS7FN42_9ACTN|nr:serine/threonine-protein kinase [Actinomadura parmotrematis]MBW8481807.1 protein kinase [Actinomadura parmotrematis]